MLRFSVCIMSFIIDANLLYVCSSMLSIFIILVQSMRIFIVSNQQRSKERISTLLQGRLHVFHSWTYHPLFRPWVDKEENISMLKYLWWTVIQILLAIAGPSILILMWQTIIWHGHDLFALATNTQYEYNVIIIIIQSLDMILRERKVVALYRYCL